MIPSPARVERFRGPGAAVLCAIAFVALGTGWAHLAMTKFRDIAQAQTALTPRWPTRFIWGMGLVQPAGSVIVAVGSYVTAIPSPCGSRWSPLNLIAPLAFYLPARAPRIPRGDRLAGAFLFVNCRNDRH